MMYIKHVLIMNIGMTANGFDLTKEMVLNSIDSFEHQPLIYNKKKEFKDYIEENISNYKNEIAIGFIAGNIEVTDIEVFADIIIKDEYKNLWNGKYDNWCIDYPIEDNKNKFRLNSIEVF